MTEKRSYEELEQRVKQLEKEVLDHDLALQATSMELALGLSEVFEALGKIASGDPSVRLPETSELELITKLKHMVNLTAENIAEIVNLSHEFAMGLAEHFDVLHKVSRGNLTARVSGISEVELMQALKKVTNEMIDSVSGEITERKRAEEQTKLQAEFLNVVLESLPHPFYVIDVSDYTIQLANSAAHRGALSKDATCYALTHRSDKPCGSAHHPCPLETIKKTEQAVTVEHLHYDRDGNPRYVEVHGYPIFDGQGNVSQIIESSLDITERKQAEEALKESEKKYSTLVENSPTGIYIDQDGKLLFANNTLSEIYGYSKAELVGIQARQLVHPEDRTFTDEIRKQRLAGEEAPSEYEARGLTKDGETIWVKRRNTRIEYQGKPAILGNVVDVTEAKNAQEALRASEVELRESEEKYRTLFDYDPNSIFVLELETFKILDVNARALAFYGYEEEELIGKSFMDLGRAPYPDGVLSTTELMSTTLCSAYPQVRHRRKDGTLFYVDVYACRTRQSGKHGIIATTVDITESLTKETQLIQASKMATLGEMATGVAHELNQPLTVMKTASSYLKRKVDKKEAIKDEILKTMAEEIDSQVDRASKIISHMREFGRKSEVQKEKVQVNEPLNNALEIFSQQLKVRGIEVVRELEEDLPPILADANRLEQVFINLLINARDAIEEKWQQADYERGAKKIFVETSASNTTVMIKVRDTGVGMPQPVLDKIFEPFFTTKEAGKGTGLGLSISYGIVKDYGGTIGVESEVGKGTIFEITFPACEEGKHNANS
jgi:PAS domain S-box-containing protein